MGDDRGDKSNDGGRLSERGSAEMRWFDPHGAHRDGYTRRLPPSTVSTSPVTHDAMSLQR